MSNKTFSDIDIASRRTDSLAAQSCAASVDSTTSWLALKEACEREWAALHGEELAANWELAQALEPLVPIDPLP
ncbi:MAG: hypothetical protein ACLP01_22750 [Solirubrobacteraceae bacterium]